MKGNTLYNAVSDGKGGVCSVMSADYEKRRDSRTQGSWCDCTFARASESRVDPNGRGTTGGSMAAGSLWIYIYSST